MVTLAVRLVAYNYGCHLSLPYSFGITTSKTASETWKEAVMWKQEFGTVPSFLASVVPWYTEYIPKATSDVYVAVLCLCDALTAFFVCQWPSASPHLVYTLFVLNPFMVLLPPLESLLPLEHLLLAIIVECCRRSRVRSWTIHIARLVAPVLGFHFIAVVVALWFPVGAASQKITHIGIILCTACMGAFGLLFLWWWGTCMESSSLFAPPDNGVMWYVRLLILPAFHSCLEVCQIQLPAALTLLFSTGVPPENKESTKMMKYGGCVPGDRRLLIVLLAICLSKLFCNHLILSDYAVMVLFIYSLLGVEKKKGMQSMLERMRAQNVFVPVFTLLLVIPLQYSFYTGWVMWDTANPNWVFFPQVAFVTVGGIFLLTFVDAIVEAIKEEESITEKKRD
ncbi:hypothetical protein TRVL_04504 [Trypanosoma vivax]|nr:hypothetical protein TRVL_04504 [Trypanosoma vivax]